MGEDVSRFIAKEGEVQVFHESQMQCASCRHRMRDAVECQVYERKSLAIMTGKIRCPDYEPDGAVH